METHAPTDDLTALVARHQGMVWRYLRALGCEASLADDLTQETFLVLLRSTSFEFRGDRPTAVYLRKTARSLFLQSLEREKRSESLDAERLAQIETAWAALHTLPEDHDGERLYEALMRCLDEAVESEARQALERQVLHGASGEEIAAELGRSPGSVRVMLHRTRQRLRACVERRVQT